MTTKTKTKLIRVVVGVLSGSAMTALFTAVLFFTAFYASAHESYENVILGWAFMAGLSGGIFGYVAGLVLGLFLGLTQRGPKFGALTGGVLGAALLAVGVVLERQSNWEPHQGF